MNVSDREVDWIISSLRSGNFRLSTHAQERMEERFITKRDLMEVGHTYIDCFLQENGTYQAEGFSIDGEVLRVICAYSGETVIVTVIAPDDVTPRGRK